MLKTITIAAFAGVSIAVQAEVEQGWGRGGRWGGNKREKREKREKRNKSNKGRGNQ